MTSTIAVIGDLAAAPPIGSPSLCVRRHRAGDHRSGETGRAGPSDVHRIVVAVMFGAASNAPIRSGPSGCVDPLLTTERSPSTTRTYRAMSIPAALTPRSWSTSVVPLPIEGSAASVIGSK